MSHIVNSDAVVFFLNKSNVQTAELLEEIQVAVKNQKLILPVLIDETSLVTEWIEKSEFNLNEFNTSKMHDLKFVFQAIKWLIQSLCELKKVSYCNNLKLNLMKNEELIDLPTRFESIDEYDMIVMRSLTKNSLIKIVSIKDGTCLREINTNFDLNTMFTWIKSSERILILERFNRMNFYDKNGTLLDSFYQVMNGIKVIAYNETNDKIYVLSSINSDDSALVGIYEVNYLTEYLVCSLDSIKSPDSLKICYNKVFIWTSETTELYIFTSEMNFLRKLYTKNDINSIFSCPNYSSYIIISSKNSIEIINASGLTYNGLIEIKGTLKMQINDKFILSDIDTGIYIISMKMDQREEAYMKREYICKMNPFKQHLLCNPHFLPCSNYACLECIYSNFNYIENSIHCNFETCQKEHKLSSALIKNLFIEKQISNDQQNIMQKMIDYGFTIINDTGIHTDIHEIFSIQCSSLFIVEYFYYILR